MIGLELTVNGQKVSAALEDGVVSIIVTKILNDFLDSINLDFTGLNTAKSDCHETIKWHSANLKVGDELIIKIKDISENSTPIEIKERSIDSINEENLKSYYAQKKDLENKGLL